MLHCRSVSHERTPLAIREQLSLTTAQQTEWLAKQNGVEAVILSTCNRLELYSNASTSQHMNALWADLLQQRAISSEQVSTFTESFSGFSAAEHLFRVSCGLESMALGEPQILGQVAHAHEMAHDHDTIGSVLSLLFRSAIHAAKRVRTETSIGAGSASISSLGITRVEETRGPLADLNILIIGAGEMGETILKALAQRNAHQVTILSRTFSRARRLADEWQVDACSITELKQAMTKADVLFTTSSAPFTILGCEDVMPIMAARANRPMTIIDIAVPRDVDPVVGNISGVALHDLDDLQHVIEGNMEERRASVPLAEHIIDEELMRFWNDYQARSVVPTIRMLREHAEELRQAELSWAFNRLPPESEHERLLFEQFSHRLMNKMLHDLTRNLKAKAAEEDAALIVSVARDLFGLEDAV